MKSNSKKDSAVSPVIGTILLVAITVVLVAIISAVVMGMTGNIGSSKVVGVQANLNDTNTGLVVTITGGADAKSLKNFSVYLEGNPAALVLNSQPSGTSPVAVGVAFSTTSANTIGSGKKTVNVVGEFTDGTNQSIYTGSFIFS